MTDTRKQLRGGGGLPGRFPKTAVPQKKRTMSSAARKRVSAARKKHWAEWHKKQGTAKK